MAFEFMLRNAQPCEAQLFQKQEAGKYGYIGQLRKYFNPDGTPGMATASSAITNNPEYRQDMADLLEYLQSPKGPKLLLSYNAMMFVNNACDTFRTLPDAPGDWAYTTTSWKYHYFIRINPGAGPSTCVMTIYMYDRISLDEAGMETVPLKYA